WRWSVVASVSTEALTRAPEEAHAAGAAMRRLRLAIPSHCPLMEGVSARLRAALAGVAVRAPRAGDGSNSRARVAHEAREVAEDLIENVSHTVRWHDSVTLLFELGCRMFVETPPGAVLSNLVQASFPEARAVALEEVPIATAVALCARRV